MRCRVWENAKRGGADKEKTVTISVEQSNFGLSVGGCGGVHVLRSFARNDGFGPSRTCLRVSNHSFSQSHVVETL